MFTMEISKCYNKGVFVFPRKPWKIFRSLILRSDVFTCQILEGRKKGFVNRHGRIQFLHSYFNTDPNPSLDNHLPHSFSPRPGCEGTDSNAWQTALATLDAYQQMTDFLTWRDGPEKNNLFGQMFVVPCKLHYLLFFASLYFIFHIWNSVSE